MILPRTRKPVRTSPRPAEPFGAGLVDPPSSPLPAIDGRGLSLDELFKVTGRRNTARSILAQDLPDATPGQLDAMADRAAQDALREVLRARPAASPLPSPEACCSPAESLPCLACNSTSSAPAIAEPAPVETADDDDDEYNDPSEWPAWCDEYRYEPTGGYHQPEPAPAEARLALDQFIGLQATRCRRFGHHAGDLLAEMLEDLAGTARCLGCRTPQDLAFHVRLRDLDDAGERLEPEPELMPSGQWA